MKFLKSLRRLLLWVVLYMAALVASVVFVIVFSLWRLVATIIIKLQFPRAKILTGFDLPFAFGITNEETVVLANFECRGYPDIKKIRQVFFEKFAKSHRRFRSYIEKKLGYNFWMEEENFCIDEHVLWFPNMTVRNCEELEKFAQNSHSTSMPLNRSPWRLDIIPWSYDFEGADGEPRYSMIFNFHHSLADGYSMFHAFLSAVSDCGADSLKIPVPKRKPTPLIWKFLNYLKLLVVFPFVIVETFLLRKNMFHKKLLSGIKINAQSRVLETLQVKRVKKAVNLPFTSLPLTCSIAAIQKFAERHSVRLPKKIVVVNGFPLWKSDEPVVPKNNFVIFPIHVRLIPSATASHRLSAVSDAFKDSNNNVRHMFFFLLAKTVFSLVPTVLGQVLFRLMSPTCAFSLGGQQELKEIGIFANGNKIDKASFILPLNKTIGIGISFYTQGEMIDISINVDSNLATKDELDQMLRDIHEEMEELDRQTHKLGEQTSIEF